MKYSQNSNSYRMPAEWEPHEATWLAWPHNVDHWPGKFDRIPPVFAAIIRALAPTEQVYICVNDHDMLLSAQTTLFQNDFPEVLLQQIRFFIIPTDSSWARDLGPIFVQDSEHNLLITDWGFNAWGQKYEPYNLDNRVPKEIAKIFSLPSVEPGIILEGGSIDVNGKGILLTTEQCLLNPNRNPHLNRLQIEQILAKFLGISQVIWLKEGIVGDDTDGHVDDIARFVNENTIVAAKELDPLDENFPMLDENWKILEKAKNKNGDPFHLVALPMPHPVYDQGMRLPASYANFYIGNRVVLVPIFNCDQDQEALKILTPLFPGRHVIGIDCEDFVLGQGTIHCSTQQQPIFSKFI